MKRNKKGFTLGEVLICIAIIGVIMALSVNAIKIVRQSYTSLTYFAFKNLQDAVGVLYSGVQLLSEDNTNHLEKAVTNCRRDDYVTISVLKSDSQIDGIACSQRAVEEENADSNDGLFCRNLAAASNTSGDINCSTFATVGYQDREVTVGDSETSTTYQEPYISAYDYDSPNFITANGQRFYISNWTYNSDYVSDTYGFRLVAIDLNSKSDPNVMQQTEEGAPLPDIVTFMVLDNGEVFPLGVAADNLTEDGRVFRYLNAKIKGYYYNYYEGRDENVIPSECTVKDGDNEIKTCNYAVVYVQNDEGTSFFSYREAYCSRRSDTELAYPNYCAGIPLSEYCPPNISENSFDLCLPYIVKPLFRYNFR